MSSTQLDGTARDHRQDTGSPEVVVTATPVENPDTKPKTVAQGDKEARAPGTPSRKITSYNHDSQEGDTEQLPYAAFWTQLQKSPRLPDRYRITKQTKATPRTPKQASAQFKYDLHKARERIDEGHVSESFRDRTIERIHDAVEANDWKQVHETTLTLQRDQDCENEIKEWADKIGYQELIAHIVFSINRGGVAPPTKN